MVSDEDEGWRRRVGGEVVERGDELLAAGEVQPGGWLVEEHHGRVVHQRAGEQHPLAFAGRQRPELTLGELGDFEALETLGRPTIVGRAVAVPPRLEGGVAGGAHDIEGAQRRAELLGEGGRAVADLTAQLAHVRSTQPLTEHVDGAGRGVLVQRGDAQERRLAAAIRAEQQPPLAGAHDHRDVVEDEGRAAPEPYVVEAQRLRHLVSVASSPD